MIDRIVRAATAAALPVVFFLGLGLVALGAWTIDPSAGIITLGIELVASAVFYVRGAE